MRLGSDLLRLYHAIMVGLDPHLGRLQRAGFVEYVRFADGGPPPSYTLNLVADNGAALGVRADGDGEVLVASIDAQGQELLEDHHAVSADQLEDVISLAVANAVDRLA